MYKDKKLLLIMRHAKSDRTLTDLIDFDRPLNERGEGEPKIIAKELNKLKIAIEKALVSSSRRTVDTWLRLEKKLDHPPEVCFDRRLYNAYYKDVIEVLEEDADDVECLMVIGHNPSMTEVCEFLTGECHEFRPASLAIVSAKSGSLKNCLKKPGCFQFEQMITAK